MLPELPKAIERLNVGAGVETQQIGLQGLCFITQREWGGREPKCLTLVSRLLKATSSKEFACASTLMQLHKTKNFLRGIEIGIWFKK